MEAKQRTIVLQTGRQTSPEPLLWDLETIEGVTITAKRLDVSFRGGGVAGFLIISMDKEHIGAVTDAIHNHLKRLKRRGDDDVVVLVGGAIKGEAEEVSFRDVRCRHQISLKGKGHDKVRDAVMEALAEGM